MTRYSLHRQMSVNLLDSGGRPGGSGGSLDLAAAPWGSEAVLGHALRGQLGQNVVQVVGVGVAVARQVGHHLRFVVDAVPHHRVGFSGGAGRPHGEDEPTHPRHLQQLQNLRDGTKTKVECHRCADTTARP